MGYLRKGLLFAYGGFSTLVVPGLPARGLGSRTANIGDLMPVLFRAMSKGALAVCVLQVVVGPFWGQSPLAAQDLGSTPQLRFHFAAMKPFAFNDRWYITAEGYHVHPAVEHFTPGINVELAWPIARNFEATIGVLAGRAPAYLGMIDENSDVEYHGKAGIAVGAVTLGPTLKLPAGRGWSVSLGPLVGYGRMTEVENEPTFGPTVAYGHAAQAVFGGRAGMNQTPTGSRFSFSLELVVLSMNVNMRDSWLQQRMSKFFGPVGILTGVSYSLY
jgi:hypothetical protein